MHIFIQLIILALGFVLLVKGSDFFVDGAVGIAKKFGISELIIGLTIVAMGTSAPEASVSIAAAVKGNADISIGNVLGSNILNILIILGIVAVIITIAVAKSTVKIEIPYMIGITIVLYLLGKDGEISRIDGCVLWILFIIYLIYLFIMAKKHTDEVEENGDPIMMPKAVLLLGVGLIMIIFGADFAVDSAGEIARAIGVSERFIGLTIVALGTSLPELFTSVTAAKKGNADIAIGNIVGSNIFNILFVIGTSAIVVPIHYAREFFFDSYVAIAAGILLLLCSFPKKRLVRFSGIIFLAGYAIYFIKLL